jgi:hypothetical protein
MDRSGSHLSQLRIATRPHSPASIHRSNRILSGVASENINSGSDENRRWSLIFGDQCNVRQQWTFLARQQFAKPYGGASAVQHNAPGAWRMVTSWPDTLISV